MKKLILLFTFLIPLLTVSSDSCFNNDLNKIKDKLLFLVTPDEYDACAQDLDFEDLFFREKIKDLDYLIVFLAQGCSLGPIEGFSNINEMLENSVAKSAEALDILVCNKIIKTVQSELIALRMFVNRPLQIEYDPLSKEARSISWQDGGFRHIFHLQDLNLHNKYEIWKKGEISILPYHHSDSLKRSRKYAFIGEIIKEKEKGNLKKFPLYIQNLIDHLIN